MSAIKEAPSAPPCSGDDCATDDSNDEAKPV